ncbi:MAG TPA: glycosyltransferase [Pseudacidobacterium sp.]|jgi:glycosyltransferase involved in cell wall biosynthesis|nr:glycosyltransferase [Pseudacidobacterium sp.]
MPNVLIYRNELLPPSETFIVAQTGAMEHHTPIFAGWKRVENSLSLPGGPPLIFNSGNTLMDKLRRKTYWSLGGADKFARAVAAKEPVVVHAHFALDAAAFVPVAQRLGIPFFVTMHGYDVTSHDRDLCRSFVGRNFLAKRRQLREAADCFLCVSEFIRRTAIERGYPEGKLLVHYIGVDCESFTRDNAIQREPIVLFVGRLVEVKGCIHLIRAMTQIEARFPSARLVVIGDGPLRTELQEAARRQLKRCEFLGVQSSESIKKWLNRSSVFCVPSISEGLGIGFLEAQSMGVPVVSFKTGGIPEAVIHGEGGLLAPQKDEKTLAEYISIFLEDDKQWELASKAGRQWVMRTFDLKRQTRLLEEHYLRFYGASSSGSAVEPLLNQLQVMSPSSYGVVPAASHRTDQRINQKEHHARRSSHAEPAGKERWKI